MRRRALVVLGAALAALARAEAAPSAGAGGIAPPVPPTSPAPHGPRPPAPAREAASTTLRVALMPHSGDERLVLHDWIARYRESRPDARIEVRPLPPDTFKATLREHLAHDPDVADVNYWFAGERLAELASAGLLAPLDDLWRDARLDDAFGPPLQRVVSFRGRPFAVPLNYYQWGFYYRRSTFERARLAVPRTWDEFLAMGDRARAAGLAPTAVGAADTWTLAAWFDYFDLRLNGLAFHQSLADGSVPFDDPRVRRVFAAWQQARERGVFLPEALPLGWRDAVPFLLRERAATILMGNFFEGLVPLPVRGDLGFFPFPRMDPRMPSYEDAPVDVLTIAARSRHPEEARAFLRWAAQPQPQAWLASASDKVPTHRLAPVSGDRLTLAGAELLRGCAGLSQFFDRDAPTALAQPALEVFGRFMSGAMSVDDALDRLEGARRAMRAIS